MSDQNWKERFKKLKENYNWTDDDIARISGNKAKSIYDVVNYGKIPAWLKFAIIIYEIEKSIRTDIQEEEYQKKIRKETIKHFIEEIKSEES